MELLKQLERIIHDALRNLQFRYTDQYSDDERLPFSSEKGEYHLEAQWSDDLNLWNLYYYAYGLKVYIASISMDVPEDDVIHMLATVIYDLESYKD